MVCKNYSPSPMLQGDCFHCGHSWQAHQAAEEFPTMGELRAPKRIWAVPSMGIHGWADGLCSDTPTSVGKKASDEYILASEHARIVAEKDARIAELEYDLLFAQTQMEAVQDMIPAEHDVLKKRLAEMGKRR